MSKSDGAEKEDNTPKVTLVIFGDIDNDISYFLLKYLKTFVMSFEPELQIVPSFPLIRKSNPHIDTLDGRQKIFSKELDTIDGDIVIGITDIGIWDLFPHPRFIFGFGGNTRGLVSLCRFKKETTNKNLLKERVGKEVLKIFARACHVDDCAERECILIYHWKTEDFDINRHVCEKCRSQFAISLKQILAKPAAE